VSLREKITALSGNFQTTHAGPLVDLGAALLRSSQQRDTPADERKARGRELAGRALLAVGVYSFMREMFAAAESYGYASGRRVASVDERAGAFHAGRHAGWTEASVHWGLGLPAGIEPYRDGAENLFPWPGRVGLDGIPVDPFAEPHVDEGQAQEGQAEEGAEPRRGWLVDERQAEEAEPETVLSADSPFVRAMPAAAAMVTSYNRHHGESEPADSAAETGSGD
jgi:hypothetical protein